jgi:hypothetical protein
MSVFGGMNKGERNRIKVGVRTAMASQTLFEGRYLGGRPPYGHTLKDLGPHPNPAKAATDRRLHGLTPHPETAPVVRIFAEYLRDDGIFAIAERLTAEGIPCPSAHDRRRNPIATAVPGPIAPSGHAHQSPLQERDPAPRAADHLTRPWLAREFAPQRREHTINTVLQQARVGLTPPTTTTTADPMVSEYDGKIAKYRAALEAGADPKLVTTWIAEAQAARDRARDLRPKQSPQNNETCD